MFGLLFFIVSNCVLIVFYSLSLILQLSVWVLLFDHHFFLQSNYTAIIINNYCIAYLSFKKLNYDDQAFNQLLPLNSLNPIPCKDYYISLIFSMDYQNLFSNMAHLISVIHIEFVDQRNMRYRNLTLSKELFQDHSNQQAQGFDCCHCETILIIFQTEYSYREEETKKQLAVISVRSRFNAEFKIHIKIT